MTVDCTLKSFTSSWCNDERSKDGQSTSVIVHEEVKVDPDMIFVPNSPHEVSRNTLSPLLMSKKISSDPGSTGAPSSVRRSRAVYDDEGRLKSEINEILSLKDDPLSNISTHTAGSSRFVSPLHNEYTALRIKTRKYGD